MDTSLAIFFEESGEEDCAIVPHLTITSAIDQT